MAKLYESVLTTLFLITLACSPTLTAADDLPTKLADLHASLTSLKHKLQALQNGLISIYENLNQGKAPYFVASNIKKFINLKVDGVTVTLASDVFDDTTGEFSQTITYQLTPGTQATLEFKHNRAAKQGVITIHYSGPNEYARWEKVADYAQMIAALMDVSGAVMSIDHNGVTFAWPFQENQWYSSQLDVLAKITLLLAQATGGLTQKVTDSAGKEKIVAGPVMKKSGEAFDALKKIIKDTNLVERLKGYILDSSLNGQRPNFFLTKALDVIKASDDGNNDWQKVFEIIKRFFQKPEYAAQADLFYFKACHTPSPIDFAKTPDEVVIPDYKTLTEHELDVYDQDVTQDPVKKVCAVSSFRGGLIQNIVQKIVKDKRYETFSQVTWVGLLNLIEQHADFFARRGSWGRFGLGASTELKVILQAAGSIIDLKDQVKKIIDSVGGYSLTRGDALTKANATSLSALYVPLSLGTVPDAQALAEQFFANQAHDLITRQPTLDLFKKAYQALKPVQLPATLTQFIYDVCPFTNQQKEREFNHLYQKDLKYTHFIDQCLEALNYLREQGHDFHALDAVLAFRLATQNFSWVAPQLLAGMQQPASTRDIKMLEWLGIGLIVSLNKDLNNEAWWPGTLGKQGQTSVVDKFLYIPSGDTPEPAQIQEFLQAVDQAHKTKKRAVVHCQFGQSRTGTMLAVWLIARHGMSPRQAIDYLRTIRHPSIDSNQEKFVEKYKPSN
ncbi:dual specificity protein phosphatase family protein [Candidatus Dependentiae bacterium]|nr:dual specificity protein phosphatase family protein [Candidatus Dependentiae bacterium]